MTKNLTKFGKLLKELRMKKNLSLRDVCKLVDYDPSNWSKIERGIISPPSDKDDLIRWARSLGLKQDQKEYQEFIDFAQVAQGIIPKDILASEQAIEYLPAFFRTLRNEKPTKEEIDELIQILRNS